jgi:predicted RNA-binding protein YlqC (UPF0109 family)
MTDDDYRHHLLSLAGCPYMPDRGFSLECTEKNAEVVRNTMSKRTHTKHPRSVMNTDLKDLEVTRKLRDLANLQVNDWEIGDLLPAVKELANKEVAVADFFRRTANYRIIEWELPGRPSTQKEDDWEGLPEKTSTCVQGISMFLQYVAQELVIHPDCVKVEVFRRKPADFRFQLVLPREDAAALIGHGGHTAAAIRHAMEAAGIRYDLSIDLKIITREQRQDRLRAIPPSTDHSPPRSEPRAG